MKMKSILYSGSVRCVFLYCNYSAIASASSWQRYYAYVVYQPTKEIEKRKRTSAIFIYNIRQYDYFMVPQRILVEINPSDTRTVYTMHKNV